MLVIRSRLLMQLVFVLMQLTFRMTPTPVRSSSSAPIQPESAVADLRRALPIAQFTYPCTMPSRHLIRFRAPFLHLRRNTSSTPKFRGLPPKRATPASEETRQTRSAFSAAFQPHVTISVPSVSM